MKNPMARAGLQLLLRHHRDEVDSPEFVALVEAIKELKRLETLDAFVETAYATDNLSLLRGMIDPEVLGSIDAQRAEQEEEEKDDPDIPDWISEVMGDGCGDNKLTREDVEASINALAASVYEALTLEEELEVIHQVIGGADVQLSYSRRHADFAISRKDEGTTIIQLEKPHIVSAIIALMLALDGLNEWEQ